MRPTLSVTLKAVSTDSEISSCTATRSAYGRSNTSDQTLKPFSASTSLAVTRIRSPSCCTLPSSR